MPRPPLPSWSVLSWSTNANYPAGSDPWAGSPTKLLHPGATGGFVPAQGSAAEYFNYNYNILGLADQAALTFAGSIADMLDPASVTVWQKGSVASAIVLAGPVWEPVTGRWIGISDISSMRVPQYSFDGVTWTSGADLSCAAATSMASNPAGLTVFCETTGIAKSLPANSTTWSSWTCPNTTAFKATVWMASASLFVAIGATFSGPVTKVVTSPGAANWTDRSSGVPASLQAISGWLASASPTMCVAVTQVTASTSYMTSTDGITWTLRTTLPVAAGEAIRAIRWSTTDACFLAVTQTSTASMRILASFDGLTWSVRSTFSSTGWTPYYLAVAGTSRTIWVLLAARGGGGGHARVGALYSLDAGVTWRDTDMFLSAAAILSSTAHASSNGERFMLADGVSTTAISAVSLGNRAVVT